MFTSLKESRKMSKIPSGRAFKWSDLVTVLKMLPSHPQQKDDYSPTWSLCVGSSPCFLSAHIPKYHLHGQEILPYDQPKATNSFSLICQNYRKATWYLPYPSLTTFEGVVKSFLFCSLNYITINPLTCTHKINFL